MIKMINFNFALSPAIFGQTLALLVPRIQKLLQFFQDNSVEVRFCAHTFKFSEMDGRMHSNYKYYSINCKENV